MTLSNTPKYQPVVVVDEHLEGLYGKGYLPANLRIFMGDDGAVKVYCYYHLDNGFIDVTLLFDGVVVGVAVVA